MSPIKITQSGLLAVLVSMSVACGKQQDPTKDAKYEPLRKAVPSAQRTQTRDAAMLPLFAIDCLQSVTQDQVQATNTCQLNFVQDVEKSVYFRVRLNIAGADKVNYSLALETTELEDLGATFKNVSPDVWELKWRPTTNIISKSENTRTIDVPLKFVLSQNNSRIVQNQFAGYDLKLASAKYQIIVQKNNDEPLVQDAKISPASTLNPTQTAKIQFTVVASGFGNKDNIDINLISGPQAPSLELTQVDAKIGSTGRLRLISVTPVDKNGKAHLSYEMDFDARKFSDYVLTKIYETEYLKNKFERGQIKSAEAILYVEAINRYNGRKSPEKPIQFEVNLIDKPGRAILVGSEAFQVRAGRELEYQFFIRSSDSRSQIKIEQVDMAGEKIKWQNGRINYDKNDVQASISCGAKTAGLNEQFNCKAGVCYENCVIKIQTACETAAQRVPVNLTVATSMRGQEEKTVLPISLQVTEKSTSCTKTVNSTTKNKNQKTESSPTTQPSQMPKPAVKSTVPANEGASV